MPLTITDKIIAVFSVVVFCPIQDWVDIQTLEVNFREYSDLHPRPPPKGICSLVIREEIWWR